MFACEFRETFKDIFFFFFRTHPAAASDFGQVQEQQQQQIVDAKTYLKINKYIEKKKNFLDFSDFVQ